MMKLFIKTLGVREFYSSHTLLVEAIGKDFVLATYYRDNYIPASMQGNFRRELFNGEVNVGDRYIWHPAKDGSMRREDFERIVKQDIV